jgi:flagellar assembly protein FliH
MLKAVFRPNELITLEDKVIIESPSSFPEMTHLTPVEETVEDTADVEVYEGPTAEDLRREAEAFRIQWEEEKERMIADSKAEAENIIQNAREAAFQEVKRQTDEAAVNKQQAEIEAEKIITEAKDRAIEIENEVRQSLESERKKALDDGREEGRREGYTEGKAEVERLVQRTQVMLERAQDKRGEILNETEKEIMTLVLLIARKVIKIISENQRDVIISNVVQSLRKIKGRGSVIIRVNMADLQLATEHKDEFIKMVEGASSVQIVEDSTVDLGGCIIETDFGEIDARISSQLAELESKILEVSPIKSTMDANIPQPVINTASLNAELAASSALMNAAAAAAEAAKAEAAAAEIARSEAEKAEAEKDPEVESAANAALTASAALAALATMGMKGKRKGDKDQLLTAFRRKNDQEPVK